VEENAGTVVVVDVGTEVVEVAEVVVVVDVVEVAETLEGCVVVDERAAGRLLLQLAKRTARAKEPRPNAICLPTAIFFRSGRQQSPRAKASRRFRGAGGMAISSQQAAPEPRLHRTIADRATPEPGRVQPSDVWRPSARPRQTSGGRC
jgi:hypothetical protein